jgi:hypothetical protein
MASGRLPPTTKIANHPKATTSWRNDRSRGRCGAAGGNPSWRNDIYLLVFRRAFGDHQRRFLVASGQGFGAAIRINCRRTRQARRHVAMTSP